MSPFEKIDAARIACGFLTVRETLEVLEGNLVLDPFSTLVSASVGFGRNNVIYPGVTLRASGAAAIVFADENTLHAGTLIEASHGDVTIGSNNQFGEGGFTAKANRDGARIQIGSNGRYLNNPSVFGACCLGDGTQILGNITVDSCSLGDGGSFMEPDPDLRGGLLKGSGVARNLCIPKGKVIVGNGTISEDNLLPQSHFHPKS
ncbi:AraC family transcriptional regulator [Roseibium sp. RKSG952]|nr:AraC family transcriptional regulator [Roseibium sp. RKSG952]